MGKKFADNIIMDINFTYFRCNNDQNTKIYEQLIKKKNLINETDIIMCTTMFYLILQINFINTLLRDLSMRTESKYASNHSSPL